MSWFFGAVNHEKSAQPRLRLSSVLIELIHQGHDDCQNLKGEGRSQDDVVYFFFFFRLF